ncbi:Tyr recombinase domain-containing protein [uncultured Gammaproteobacteria bacterium]
MSTFDKQKPSMIILEQAKILTFDDVLNRINLDQTLTPTVRQNMITAVCRTAKAISIEGLFRIVDAAEVARLLSKLTAAKMGFKSDQSLSAFKSNLRRALRISGIRVTDGRAKNKLTPEWSELMERVDDQWSRAALSSFVHFVSDQGLKPIEVTATHLEDFCAYRMESALSSKARQITRDTNKAWQNIQSLVAEWPRTKLTPSLVCDWFYGLPWCAFPSSLECDVEAFVSANTDNPLGWMDDCGTRKAITNTNYRNCFRRMASIIVQNNSDADDINGLVDLVTIDHANEILHFMHNRTQRKHGGHINLMALLLYVCARDYLKLDQVIVKQLKMYFTSTKAKNGMANKTRERLYQFEDESLLNRVLWLPDTLLGIAKNKPVDLHTAKLVRGAVYLMLAFDISARSGNITALDMNEHFFQQGDRIWIGVPGEQVKNKQDIRVELRQETASIVRLYIEAYRPAHVEKPCSYLFPRKDGSHWSVSQAYEDIIDLAARHAGCDLNPHLIRAIIVKLILDDSPNALPIAQHNLAHKTMQTTAASYLDISKKKARIKYHEILDERRKRS